MDLPKGLIMDLGAVRKEHSSGGRRVWKSCAGQEPRALGREAREVVVRWSCLGGRGEQVPSGRASWASALILVHLRSQLRAPPRALKHQNRQGPQRCLK